MHNRIPNLLEMMRGLIALPSMSSVNPEYDHSNLKVIEQLAEWLEQLGFAIEINPIAGQKNKANLIATLGRGSGGLVLSGHTDTVPFDEGRWHNDPFHLTEKNGRFYGLGTADMKTFLALAIEAAGEFKASDLSQPLIILATADEESSMSGARALQQSAQPNARYAIIGEPTNLKPIYAHKGILMESIRIIGRSGHSSNPTYGFNAMEEMFKVAQSIITWRNELQLEHHNDQFLVPVPTLNLGHIHGGDNPNRICGECELQIDLRPLPGMSLTELRQELRHRVEQNINSEHFKIQLQSLIHGTEPMYTDPTSSIIKIAEKLTDMGAETAAYCTEAPYYNAMGMETVVLGPGNIAQAHQANEYIDAASLPPTVTLLKKFIEKFCMESQLKS